MSLHILRHGVLDTIQDQGRHGLAKWGVNTGGAMDRYAARVANALVANELNAAVIEMHFPAPEIALERAAVISVTGADFEPVANGAPLPMWKTVALPASSTLSFQKKLRGARSYLAVHGGLDVPPWLGSRSTNLKISAGGFHGRRLLKGDRLSVKPPVLPVFKNPPQGCVVYSRPTGQEAVYMPADRIGFIPGSEWDWLTTGAKQLILGASFQVAPSSDRMAMILAHERLEFQTRDELLSSAVTFGTLQAMPAGNLIVLMADHQTIGGYPRIGNVITAHLPRLAQCGAHEAFQLHEVSAEAAEKMLFSLQENVVNIQQECLHELHRFYAEH